MSDEVLKKFGRYFLLDRVAQGGMAEIYRARLASVDGAGRLLVIKRILAGHGADQEFVSMFRSEIKMMMGFNHPHIVQLYDFGEEQEQPYIAMEFVDGKNLRQFLMKLAEVGQCLPVEVAVSMITQSAAGLHYAHSYKDKISGEPLYLVHRDISPQNILISYDGTIKVIDFGIAKADVEGDNTRAGIIKGKPSYLSPEQISGEKLDGRSDIFALGIVFWELLTGRKLFAAPGENEFAVLKLIESCQTYVKPPSQFNAEIPKELDHIVLRMLAKQREKRFQTAEELQGTLHRFLTSFVPDFSPSDISHWARGLFKNEIVRDRQRLQELSHKAEALLASNRSEVFSGKNRAGESVSGGQQETTTIVSPRLGAVRKIDSFELSKEDNEAGSLIQLASSGSGVVNQPKKVQQSRGYQNRERTTPDLRAKSQENIKPDSAGSSRRPLLIIIAASLLVILFGPDFGVEIPYIHSAKEEVSGEQTREVRVPEEQARAERAVAQQTPDPVPPNTILMRVNVAPVAEGAEIWLNGERLAQHDAFIRVPLDAPLDLRVQRESFQPLRREFVLASREVRGLSEWMVDVELEPIHFGYLTIYSTPSARAYIRGIDQQSRSIASEEKPWILGTPLEKRQFPAGTYEVHLKNEILGMEKTVVIQVKSGQLVRVDEKLDIVR
jgi:serine/threonine protein kinase